MAPTVYFFYCDVYDGLFGVALSRNIMFGKLLMIKPRFESTNENQLTLESNLAVEVKIDSDGIKFTPNHRVSQMFDWQLVR